MVHIFMYFEYYFIVQLKLFLKMHVIHCDFLQKKKLPEKKQAFCSEERPKISNY